MVPYMHLVPLKIRFNPTISPFKGLISMPKILMSSKQQKPEQPVSYFQAVVFFGWLHRSIFNLALKRYMIDYRESFR